MIIKFGAIVTDGRGKIGGMFVKRTANGHSLNNLPRTKTKSILKTAPQLNKLGYLFRIWGSQSSSDQDLYLAIAIASPVVDKFGNLKTLTARQMFTKLNSRVFLFTNTLIDVVNYNNDNAVYNFSESSIDYANEEVNYEVITISGTSNVLMRIDQLNNSTIATRFINSKVLQQQTISTNLIITLWGTLLNKYPLAKVGDTYQVSFVAQNDYGVQLAPVLFKWTFV